MQTRKASIKETGEELTEADWERFEAAVGVAEDKPVEAVGAPDQKPVERDGKAKPRR